jgi:hypothetical protein
MTGEEILGVFSAEMETGGGAIFKKYWECKVTITTHRMVATETRRPIFPGLGGGHPEYIATRASTRDRLKMQAISAERVGDMLKANAKNFEISYSDVTVVEARPKFGPDVVNLRIYMGNLDIPKYMFILRMSRRYFDEFKTLLETVLPGKV